ARRGGLGGRGVRRRSRSEAAPAPAHATSPPLVLEGGRARKRSRLRAAGAARELSWGARRSRAGVGHAAPEGRESATSGAARPARGDRGPGARGGSRAGV